MPLLTELTAFFADDCYKDFAPNGAGRFFWTGGYKDVAPNGAGPVLFGSVAIKMSLLRSWSRFLRGSQAHRSANPTPHRPALRPGH